MKRIYVNQASAARASKEVATEIGVPVAVWFDGQHWAVQALEERAEDARRNEEECLAAAEVELAAQQEAEAARLRLHDGVPVYVYDPTPGDLALRGIETDFQWYPEE